MTITSYGYIQLLPPLLDAMVEADIDRIHNWRNIGLVSVDPNLWGLSRFQGAEGVIGKAVAKAVKGSELVFKSRFLLEGIDFKPWEVMAYHEIIYGYKPWEYSETHPRPVKTLELPTRVANLYKKSIVLYTDHEIRKSSTKINFSYDMWLMRSATDMKCSKGDIELMIWLYRSPDLKPLPKDADTVVEIPILLNGKITTTKLEAYITEITLPSGIGGWTYIAFTLENPVEKGSIALDFTSLLEITREVLAKHMPSEWNGEKFDDLYLRSVEVGTEVFFSNRVDVEWSLREMHIAVLPTRIASEKALESLADPLTLFKGS